MNIETKERDAFVAMLKTLIDGWRAQMDSLPAADGQKKYMQLQVLVAKTNKFLRDEFGEK